MSFVLTIAHAQQAQDVSAWVKEYVPLIAAASTFAVALAGFFLNGYLQRRADQRKFDFETGRQAEELAQRKEVARLTLYAQLFRMYKTILRQRHYIEVNASKFIWITVFRDALPSSANVTRVELLTPEEVIDLTSFFYSYQEHIGFITANAQRSAGDEKKVDIDIIGYDYVDGRRLTWLLWSLDAMERKLVAGMEAIRAAVAREYPVDSAMARITASSRIAPESAHPAILAPHGESDDVENAV